MKKVLLILLLLAAVSVIVAQENSGEKRNEPASWQILVFLKDGSKIKGAIENKEFQFKTAYGVLTAPLKEIKEIKFSGAKKEKSGQEDVVLEEDEIETAGFTAPGSLLLDKFSVTALGGVLNIDKTNVARIIFSSDGASEPVEPSRLFWEDSAIKTLKEMAVILQTYNIKFGDYPPSGFCPRDGNVEHRVMFGSATDNCPSVNFNDAKSYHIEYTRIHASSWRCTADTDKNDRLDFYIDSSGVLRGVLSSGDGCSANDKTAYWANRWIWKTPRKTNSKPGEVMIFLSDGDKIRGVVDCKELQLKTQCGILTIPLGDVKRVFLAGYIKDVRNMGKVALKEDEIEAVKFDAAGSLLLEKIDVKTSGGMLTVNKSDIIMLIFPEEGSFEFVEQGEIIWERHATYIRHVAFYLIYSYKQQAGSFPQGESCPRNGKGDERVLFKKIGLSQNFAEAQSYTITFVNKGNDSWCITADTDRDNLYDFYIDPSGNCELRAAPSTGDGCQANEKSEIWSW